MKATNVWKRRLGSFLAQSKKTRYFNVLLLLAAFFVLLGVRLFVNHSVTGDEPHYLLIDYSLAHDRDFDLKNNYLNHDYYRYYQAELAPHIGNVTQAAHARHWYSFHGIGLPLILLPFYILADRTGVVVGMTLIATITLAAAYVWVQQITHSRKLAYVSAAGLLASFFFNGLSGYIYPDMLLCCLCLCSLVMLTSSHKLTRVQEVILAALNGLLVFVHFKTLAFVGPFMLTLGIIYWLRYRRLPLTTYLFTGLFIALFLLSLHHWFGVWIPTKIYASTVHLTTSPFFTVPAMLFDSLRGFLIYNPLFWLLPIGLPLWYKVDKLSFYAAIFPIIPSAGLLAVFNEWQGGDAPTGRYVLLFAVVLLPAVALAIRYIRRSVPRIGILLLAFLTVIISVVSVLRRYSYVGIKTRAPLFSDSDTYFHVPLDRLLPTFTLNNTFMGRHDAVKVLFYSAVLLFLLGYGFYLARSIKPMTPK